MLKIDNENTLSPALNRLPRRFQHVHLMGICGTGMASMAGMLKEMGYHVTGSDQNIYPPMSTFLESLSIPVAKGYGARNLDPAPDLVIVGNVITRDNPEARELARMKLLYLSFPQALKRFAIEGKRSVVISGTHGKTTAASLAAWLLQTAGEDPTFMIGGIPLNFGTNFKLGRGRCVVVEGDEYDTAFFDKGPKFLHYDPWAVILTSIEFDHADIYRDLDHVIESFRELIAIIPRDGILIANLDDPVIAREITRATCRIRTYGMSDRATWRAVDLRMEEGFTRFTAANGGEAHADISTPLYGRHNVRNLLSVLALSDALGVSPGAAQEASRTFLGVKRRQEIIGEARGALILDDFAHHPTAVSETVAAVKQRHDGRRLIAVFEPRSNSSRRNIFQDRYADAFARADLTFIPEPVMMEKIPPGDRFSSQRLVQDLESRKQRAFCFTDRGLMLDALEKEVLAGDVVLFMSNGEFDNLPRRLFRRLQVIED
ncbi:MAG: UDP-N-acetylmuramate:L-alanyl-gamma-D-glutamyl-meso-diaminopimelate ligase [Deltaproteobacteria bacterium]|nr:UDP-N-acetylmuramate:L-alanyl-gamma-D-glutamyl-meso-diaminopimelate ligase [Deltaproteobacteria bacterium]